MACALKWVDRPVPCFSLIFLGSIVLSLSAALAMRAGLRPEQLDMDELEYYTIAGQVADGSYEFYPRRTVGHLLVLGALRKAFNDRLVPIQLAVSAIFSLAAPLAYLLARRELRDDRAALLGGVGVMLWPLFVRYGATLYSETVACHCSLGFCWRCRASGRRVTGGAAVGSGGGGPRPLYALPSHVPVVQPVWSPRRVLARPRRPGRAGPRRALGGRLPHGCRAVVSIHNRAGGHARPPMQ